MNTNTNINIDRLIDEANNQLAHVYDIRDAHNVVESLGLAFNNLYNFTEEEKKQWCDKVITPMHEKYLKYIYIDTRIDEYDTICAETDDNKLLIIENEYNVIGTTPSGKDYDRVFFYHHNEYNQ